ncbi:hypothetical protein D3C76_1210470 [compost metagenome]
MQIGGQLTAVVLITSLLPLLEPHFKHLSAAAYSGIKCLHLRLLVIPLPGDKDLLAGFPGKPQHRLQRSRINHRRRGGRFRLSRRLLCRGRRSCCCRGPAGCSSS